VCNEIKRRNLKVNWIIHARIDEITNPLLKLLGESGCILIRFGMESGVERIVSLLKKTNNAKAWLDKSKSVVQTAQSNGINVACLFIVGAPTETLQEVEESISFARDLNPDIIQVAYFTPFPGTQAYKLYGKKVSEEAPNEQQYHYSAPKINVSAMTDKELSIAQGLFYRKFLGRPLYLMRHFVNNTFFYIMNSGLFIKLLYYARRA